MTKLNIQIVSTLWLYNSTFDRYCRSPTQADGKQDISSVRKVTKPLTISVKVCEQWQWLMHISCIFWHESGWTSPNIYINWNIWELNVMWLQSGKMLWITNLHCIASDESCLKLVCGDIYLRKCRWPLHCYHPIVCYSAILHLNNNHYNDPVDEHCNSKQSWSSLIFIGSFTRQIKSGQDHANWCYFASHNHLH